MKKNKAMSGFNNIFSGILVYLFYTLGLYCTPILGAELLPDHSHKITIIFLCFCVTILVPLWCLLKKNWQLAQLKPTLDLEPQWVRKERAYRTAGIFLAIITCAIFTFSNYRNIPNPYSLKYQWKIKNEKQELRTVIFEGSPLIMIPGNSAAKIQVFNLEGKCLNSAEFFTGWRIDIEKATTKNLPDHNFQAILVYSRPAVNGKDVFRQYYALIGDSIALVRLENEEREYLPNTYSYSNHMIGPPVPKRTEEKWEKTLESNKTAEILRTLVWLGGYHLGYENSSDAKLVKRILNRKKAKGLIKNLTKSRDKWVKEAAEFIINTEFFNSLDRMGDKAIPALIAKLKDHNWRVRRASIKKLAKYQQKKVVLTLIEALKDKNTSVKLEAIKSLCQIAIDTKHFIVDLIPVFTEALKDEDPRVKSVAAQFLGRIGAQAKPAIPVLMETLKTPDYAVKVDVISAIGYIGHKLKILPVSVVNELIAALKGKNPEVKEAAAKSLGEIGAITDSVVPVLMAALNDQETKVRQASAEALGKMGSKAVSAVPIFIAMLEKKWQWDWWERAAIAKALGEIGPQAASAIPALVRTVKAGNVYEIGKQGSRSMTTDSEWTVKQAALEALGKIGPKAKIAKSTIYKALSHSNIKVRETAQNAMEKIMSK